MGFFSWTTSDTKKSVSNKYSISGSLPCKMILPDGTSFAENDYDGYGFFSGADCKDQGYFYE